MTREEYVPSDGADRADIAAVIAFAQETGLPAVDTRASLRKPGRMLLSLARAHSVRPIRVIDPHHHLPPLTQE